MSTKLSINLFYNLYGSSHYHLPSHLYSMVLVFQEKWCLTFSLLSFDILSRWTAAFAYDAKFSVWKITSKKLLLLEFRNSFIHFYCWSVNKSRKTMYNQLRWELNKVIRTPFKSMISLHRVIISSVYRISFTVSHNKLAAISSS